jgi:hypothetical protein
MADVKNALAVMQELIETKLAEAADLKKAANSLARSVGEPEPYNDVLVEAAPTGGAVRLRPDEFASERAPASAARAYLAVRGRSRGAATADDIYDALVHGGYDFGGAKETDAKGGLRIALAKDTKVHRLPNAHYGLREWYGLPDRDASDEGSTKRSKASKVAAPTIVVEDDEKGENREPVNN